MSHCQICLCPSPHHAVNCPVATGAPVAGALSQQQVNDYQFTQLIQLLNDHFEAAAQGQRAVMEALETLTRAHLSTVQSIEAIVDRSVRQAFERNRPGAN
ncbi:MAG TPA: hypothetical protein VFO40_04870 [Chthoniobacterales bacterium]|nr:hypothetical protein [Chthoniobacterales bacterium]